MGLGAYYANLEPSWATHSTPNPTTAPQEPPGDEQTGHKGAPLEYPAPPDSPRSRFRGCVCHDGLPRPVLFLRPSVTRFEIEPAPGVKANRIVNLADDIALKLATAGIRIEAPVPGKAVVGIEVPNREIASVHLREVIKVRIIKKLIPN